jgi:hypothetical protein
MKPASKQAADLGISIARRSAGKVIAVYVVDIQRLVQLHGYITLQGKKRACSIPCSIPCSRVRRVSGIY